MSRTSSIPRWIMLLQISFCLVSICNSNSLPSDQQMPLLPPQNVHNLVGKRDSGERAGNELEGEPQEKRSAVRMSDKVVRQIIHTPNAPQAIGPYSQAVRIGNRLLLSGSLGIDPKTGQFPAGGITEQTHQSLKNIGEVLKAAGVGYENVVQVQVLLADINDFAKMNDVYKEYFKSDFPARAAYQAAALPRGGLVEIVCEAVAGEISNL